MSRLLDDTFTTDDEEWNPPRRIAQKIEDLLGALAMDTYNEEYVVRITVDKVDRPVATEDDE